MSIEDIFFAKNFKKPLSIANKRHDCVAITITDPRETELPNAGLVELADAETGALFLIDTSNTKVRGTYLDQAKKRMDERTKLFGSINMDHIDIRTDKPYIEELIKFFKARKRRI
jgi:hypothetical protein